VQEAITNLSGIRSYYGAKQNALEHSINNNQMEAENQQASESKLRDAEMADQSMELAVTAVLAQAAQSIMAHYISNAQNILRLLQ